MNNTLNNWELYPTDAVCPLNTVPKHSGRLHKDFTSVVQVLVVASRQASMRPVVLFFGR